MSGKEGSYYKLAIAVALFCLLSLSSVLAYGQAASPKPDGVPDDWTHHHVIFSNPGTAAEALAQGRFDKWYRIVNDPRYIMQEKKRHHKPRPSGEKKPLHRDWSMNMGAIAASATGTVTTNNASGSPQSSVAIGPANFSASPPVAATQTGSFASLPTSSASTITIVNGANTLTATTNATAGQATGTFSGPPILTSSITIASGANTLVMTTNATGAHAIGTFSAPPLTGSSISITSGANTLAMTTNGTGAKSVGTFAATPAAATTITVTSGANTLNMATNATPGVATGTFNSSTASSGTIIMANNSGAATNTLTLTLSATGTNTCTSSTTGKVLNAANSTTEATNVAATINSCNTAYPAVGFTATSSGAAFTVTNTLPGPFFYSTGGTATHFSWGTTSGNSAGTNTCAGTTGTFAVVTAGVAGSSAAALGQVASNLAAAINACPVSAGVSATSSTTTVTAVDTTPGSFTTFSVSGGAAGIFTWGSVTAGTNGSNTCSVATTGTFATSSSTTTLASNLAAAIALCPVSAGVSAASSTNTVTATDLTAGNGVNTFTVADTNVTGIFSWGTVNAGSNGSNSCGSSTAGNFATSSSTTTLASNLAAAINLCPAAVGVGASSSTNTVLVTNTALGATSLSVALSNVTGIFSWGGGVTAGSNGTANACTGSTTVNYQSSNITSSVASNLSAAINLCSAADGITATPSGSNVTLTARTVGSGGNSIDLTGNGFFAWTAGTLTGGSDGVTSGTSFAYWSVNAAATTTQVAANLAAAINENTALAGPRGVSAGSSGNVVTLIANSNGTTGNSTGLSVTSFSGFAWSGADLSGGNAGGGTVGAGMYPAKYEFYSDVANCDDAATPDYVVYNTGLAGSATQPTIIAYDNLYSGCPTTSVPVPNVYWQYYTGGTILTNPVLSEDGTQVVFVQTNASSQAQLVMLKWAADLPVITPTSVSAAAYPSCTAPCMTVITFDTTTPSGGTASIPNDSYSSPFYDYNDDAVYVGENNGCLHKFSPVFFGAPAEVIASGWPILTAAAPLSSPVYDFNSTYVFVGPATGSNGSSARMHRVTTTGTATAVASGSMGKTGGAYIYADAPLVDPSAEQVYAFTNADIAGASAAVWQLPYNFAASAVGTEAAVGQGSDANPLYVGAFDNIYNSNSGPTGNLYVCGRDAASQDPALWLIPIASGTMGTPVEIGALTNAATNCSPVTEFYNGSTSIDYIFLSVQASSQTASPVSCPSNATGCIMSFEVTSALGAGAATSATLKEAGGTSGIIIDNSVGTGTLAGASQIYFSPLGSQACTGNSASTAGVGTGGCAVQASQSGLN